MDVLDILTTALNFTYVPCLFRCLYSFPGQEHLLANMWLFTHIVSTSHFYFDVCTVSQTKNISWLVCGSSDIIIVSTAHLHCQVPLLNTYIVTTSDRGRRRVGIRHTEHGRPGSLCTFGCFNTL